MSECVSVALHTRHEVAGLTMLLAAFLLFVIRTTARESQLTEAQRTLEGFAYRDTLTGLANRLSLLRELTGILKDPASLTCNVALVYIDLDHFKTVNDSLGHHFGNQVLVKVAALLKRDVGPDDCIARLAGEEFVVILHNNNEAEARAFARRIVDLLQEPIELEGRLIYITASVGTTMSRPDTSAENMIREADCAMYAAKHGGKNQERNFDTKMMEKLKASLSLETDLREALKEGSVSTYYQPIYSARDRRLAGFEALSRWHHPTRGVVSPIDFIPLAEETGLMMQLGTQTLRESCQQVREWNE